MPGISGRPKLTLSGANLLDETAPVSRINSAVGSDFFILNAPRTLSARFSLEFGA